MSDFDEAARKIYVRDRMYKTVPVVEWERLIRAQAENERLRGLLRRALPGLDDAGRRIDLGWGVLAAEIRAAIGVESDG